MSENPRPHDDYIPDEFDDNGFDEPFDESITDEPLPAAAETMVGQATEQFTKPSSDEVWQEVEPIPAGPDELYDETLRADDIPPIVRPGEETETPPTETRRRRVRQPSERTAEERDRVREIQPELIRQQRPGRLAIAPLAFGLIGLGGLLLAENFAEELEITAGAAIIILLGSFVLTTVFRFFESGRRQRGLFFVGNVLLIWGGVVALNVLREDKFPLDEFWPLTIAGVGAAFFITFLFERNHQAGLVFPGIILMFASGIAFLITLDVIGPDMTDAVKDFWPLIVAVVGLLLFPAAFQKR
ncbi:MAG: hypothetical protein K8L91_11565 [Anaerolineae bacterium]|nr:hypothetical protein [Anaerolineae bacterium]